MTKTQEKACEISWLTELLNAAEKAWQQEAISDEIFIKIFETITEKKEANQG